MKHQFLLVFTALFFSQMLMGQDLSVMPNPDKLNGSEVKPRKSPLASTMMVDGKDYARIIYNQPHLRGREMLGSSRVPYGKIWRLGANEATELFLTEDLEINGKELDEGAYSMYAIPEKDKWILIFSKKLGQWGAYSYDESSDELRISAPVIEADKPYEAFTIWFTKDGKKLNMAWDKTMVSVDVRFD